MQSLTRNHQVAALSGSQAFRALRPLSLAHRGITMWQQLDRDLASPTVLPTKAKLHEESLCGCADVQAIRQALANFEAKLHEELRPQVNVKLPVRGNFPVLPSSCLAGSSPPEAKFTRNHLLVELEIKLR